MMNGMIQSKSVMADGTEFGFSTAYRLHAKLFELVLIVATFGY
jgi:hypothetical protein